MNSTPQLLARDRCAVAQRSQLGHGDLFMTLGEDFYTLDMAQHESPETARRSARPLGVAHIAFHVASYEALAEAYRTLLQHGVRVASRLPPNSAPRTG